MYKSLIGLLVSNLLMIWIILLNDTGPGWEVPAEVMQVIIIASFALLISFAFSTITLITDINSFKVRSNLFRVLYLLILIISISFLIFLFVVDAFGGQFWLKTFPCIPFSIISIGAVLLFLILLSISRFKGHIK